MFNFSSNESVVLSNGQMIHYHLKRRQRRSLGLKITFDGLVVHAPFLMSKNKINTLLVNKTKWLLSKINSIQPTPTSFKVGDNEVFMLLGTDIIIKTNIGLKRAINISSNICMITQKDKDNDIQITQYFKKWLKQHALEFFSDRVQFYCRKNGFSVRNIYISNAKTRWGTCNSKADIRLNWRLIQAPLDVIDYVICHELSHTLFMNHSQQFWHQVSTIFPNYKDAESYLKVQGLNLYRLD